MIEQEITARALAVLSIVLVVYAVVHVVLFVISGELVYLCIAAAGGSFGAGVTAYLRRRAL